MKMQFNSEQLSYLHDKANMLLLAVRTPEADPSLYRAVCRMKYKFTPNALFVNLSVSERDLLTDLLAYRQRALVEARTPNYELKTVSELLDIIRSEA